MSKSGNYNLGEIEKRDAVIQELLEALKAINVAINCNASRGGNLGKLINKENPFTIEAIRAAIQRAEGE